jgi:hypothetical protein
MNSCRIFISSVGLSLAVVALAATSWANDLKNAEPLPAPAPSATVPAVPGPAAADTGPCCCPCIEYRHHGRPICCCDCNAPAEIKMVLVVKDPQSCCGDCVAVPVCLPGCCTGEPCVSSRCGVLGRGIVRYDFSCGVRVTVTFRARGDIVVTYLHA